MPTCGYLCPSCEGKGFLENGETCDWCTVLSAGKPDQKDKEEWINIVHNGPCCGDLGESSELDQ